MQFTGFTLELETPLHIGAGRGGMLLRSHGFVPGHVVSYALAAVIGKAKGGRPADFSHALETVFRDTRCGPLFIFDPGDQRALAPRQERERIETRYLTANNHVTLDPETCSAVETALFEVESIVARTMHGSHPGQPVRLVGGLWHTTPQLAGQPLQDWFRAGLLLGGELKVGLGRVKLAKQGWMPDARHYAQQSDWPVNEHGLRRMTSDLLPGPSLDGGGDAPLQPWLGRLYDEKLGFGRRFPGAALVRLDARCDRPGHYLPAAGEVGLGCWTCADAPTH
ncbi:MAG: hypothetical protein IT490_07550 [Candidatus Contendobacter sp.]|nr:hypothetical protein [Candidatus Contendobacter sp.]